MVNPEAVFMLQLAPRTGKPFVVVMTNSTEHPLKAQLKVFGFEREELKEYPRDDAEVHIVRWGPLNAKLLFLAPGETKTSRPMNVTTLKTHFVIAGQGPGIDQCKCEVVPVPRK